MEYDYIIVGGGITGLFAGYLLQKHDKNFLLFEKDENVGGRIQVKKFHNVTVPLGALAFRSTDKNVKKLVKELKIPTFTFKCSYNYNIPNYDPKWYNQTVKNLPETKNESVSEVLENYFHHNKELIEKFKTYSFWTDFFNDTDAYYGIKYYPKKDMYHGTIQNYFVPCTDIYEIIKVLYENIKEHVNTKQLVTKIIKKDSLWNIHDKRGNIFKAKHVILATDFSGIKYIKIEPEPSFIKMLKEYIGTNSYLRWYTFHQIVNLEKPLLVNSFLKKMFPISKHVLLSGDADNENAKKLRKKIDTSTWNTLTNLINTALGAFGNVSRIKDSFYKYWNIGTHYYKKGYNYQKDYYEEDNFIVLGEMISFEQGWTEGALQSVGHWFSQHFTK